MLQLAEFPGKPGQLPQPPTQTQKAGIRPDPSKRPATWMCGAPGGALLQLPMPALMPVPAAAETGEREDWSQGPPGHPCGCGAQEPIAASARLPPSTPNPHTPQVPLLVSGFQVTHVGTHPWSSGWPCNVQREEQSPEGKGGVFVTQQAGGRATPAPKLPLSWLQSACVPQPGHSQSLPHRKHFLSVWVTAMCPFSKPNACLKAPAPVVPSMWEALSIPRAYFLRTHRSLLTKAAHQRGPSSPCSAALYI